MQTGPCETNGGPAINERIARQFDEIAALLAARHANDFRVRAYQRGALALRELLCPVDSILDDEGRRGLEQIPGIGRSLALSIERFIQTGRLPLLEQLRGADTPEHRFESVPGIGPELAARIHSQLHVDSLADLEAAAIDGRLREVPGIGPRRSQSVRDALGRRPSLQDPRLFQRPRPEALPAGDEPSIGELLSVDAEYRRKAARDELIRIAPKRFNPTGQAWLPILRTRRGARHYFAAWSNTAHAHELGMIHDWVVIRRTDPGQHQQWTVITSLLGRLKGRRIVRGHELRCAAFYRQHPVAADIEGLRSAGVGTDPVEPDVPQPRQRLLFDPETVGNG